MSETKPQLVRLSSGLDHGCTVCAGRSTKRVRVPVINTRASVHGSQARSDTPTVDYITYHVCECGYRCES